MSEVKERRTILRGRVLDIGVERVRLPNGVETELEIIHHPGAAAIVPLTENGEILLLRQFRHAAGGELWEIPAGTLEPGEEPRACALREVAEEACVRAADLVDLGVVVPVPGYSTERIHLFLARSLVACDGKLDRDELISEVRPVPVAEVRRWLAEGTIVDAKTIVALERAERRGLLPGV